MIEPATTTPKEWTDPSLDKSAWGDGPWRDEPDLIQWVDGITGLDCFMARTELGHWCGYVGVPEGHPDRGRTMQEVPDLTVHGGITFSAQTSALPLLATTAGSAPWWFGFDCAHFLDLVPGVDPHLASEYERLGRGGLRIYRDRAFVEKECRRLAGQLAARGRVRGGTA